MCPSDFSCYHKTPSRRFCGGASSSAALYEKASNASSRFPGSQCKVSQGDLNNCNYGTCKHGRTVMAMDKVQMEIRTQPNKMRRAGKSKEVGYAMPHCSNAP